jgi:hypothetical protein
MNYSDILIKEEETKLYELTTKNKQLQEKIKDIDVDIKSEIKNLIIDIDHEKE